MRQNAVLCGNGFKKKKKKTVFRYNILLLESSHLNKKYFKKCHYHFCDLTRTRSYVRNITLF